MIRKILIISILALATRLTAWQIDPFGPPREDSRQYHRLGANLADVGRYSLSDEPPYFPSARRMPGYPLFLAAIYRIGGADHRLAELVQVGLGSALCLGVYAIGRSVFESEQIGLVAALLTAVSPPLIYFSVAPMAETLFAVVLLASVWGADRWSRSGNVGPALATSGFWGTLTLIKPDAALLPAFVVPTVLLAGNYPKRLLMQSLVTVAVAVAVVSPWVIRNKLVFGKAGLQVGSSDSEGDADGSGLLREYRLLAEHELLLRPERHAFLYGDGLDAAQARYERAMASSPAEPSQSDAEFFLRRPITFLTYCAVRFYQLVKPSSWSEALGIWTGFGESGGRRRGAVAALKGTMLLFDGLVLTFGFIGVAATFRRTRRRLLIVSATVIYFVTFYSLLHGIPRYRVSLYPLLLLLGTWWLLSFLHRWRMRSRATGEAGDFSRGHGEAIEHQPRQQAARGLKTRTTRSSAEIETGFVFVPDGRNDEFTPADSWRSVAEIRPHREGIAGAVIKALRCAGVPERYVSKLLPDRGKSWHGWKVGGQESTS